MSKKTDVIIDAVRNISLLSTVYHNLIHLRDTYLDEGFHGAGADYILPADIELAGYDFSHTELEMALNTMVEQLILFMEGASIITTPGDYDKAMNLVLKLPS